MKATVPSATSFGRTIVQTIEPEPGRFAPGATNGRPVGREPILQALLDRRSTGGAAVVLGPRRGGKSWVARELLRLMAAEGDGDSKPQHQLAIAQMDGGAVGTSVLRASGVPTTPPALSPWRI